MSLTYPISSPKSIIIIIIQIFCRNFAPKVTPGFELEHPNGGIPIDELAKDEVRECDDREWQDALEEFGDSKPQVGERGRGGGGGMGIGIDILF